MSEANMPKIGAPSFHNYLDKGVVVFQSVKGSTTITDGQTRRNIIN